MPRQPSYVTTKEFNAFKKEITKELKSISSGIKKHLKSVGITVKPAKKARKKVSE